jgi:DNA-binding domain/Domain of unknown function (DUF4469) with IG-like fold
MLKYNLLDNPLTERPDDYAAQTIVDRTSDKEAIITEILRRGNLVTRTDAVAVLNAFEETVVDIVRDGGTINLPLFNTSFSISGVFDGPMDSFDANRHKLKVNLSKGTLLRNAEKQVGLEKTSAVSPQPNILEVKDAVSGKVNEVLTPGGVLQVWGNNIRIAGDNSEVGLWFVPESGSAVKAGVVVTNKPSNLIAMIPALAPGNWTVKVATQYTSGGTLLSSPRTSTFDKVLAI